MIIRGCLRPGPASFHQASRKAQRRATEDKHIRSPGYSGYRFPDEFLMHFLERKLYFDPNVTGFCSNGSN